MFAADTLDRLLPFTDLVLFDLKLFDAGLHRQYTGSANRQHPGQPAPPARAACQPAAAVPPVDPHPAHPRRNRHAAKTWPALGAYLGEHLDGSVERWELCAFNNLCRDKYTRLGLDWAYARTPLLTAAELAACEQARQIRLQPSRNRHCHRRHPPGGAIVGADHEPAPHHLFSRRYPQHPTGA